MVRQFTIIIAHAAILITMYTTTFLSAPSQLSTSIAHHSAPDRRPAFIPVEAALKPTEAPYCSDELLLKRSDLTVAETRLRENRDPDLIRFWRRRVYGAQVALQQIEEGCKKEEV
jgi:hypothetical protein